MTEDARFEDATERPVRLRALDSDDLAVISSMVQDAVLPVTEMRWQRAARRFVLLLNRFRWEDAATPARSARPVERVRSLLSIEVAAAVQVQGIDRGDVDTILSLLAVEFAPGDDGGGYVMLTFAGDGALRVAVEALEVTLQDVTRPYAAVSGRAPRHSE